MLISLALTTLFSAADAPIYFDRFFMRLKGHTDSARYVATYTPTVDRPYILSFRRSNLMGELVDSGLCYQYIRHDDYGRRITDTLPNHTWHEYGPGHRVTARLHYTDGKRTGTWEWYNPAGKTIRKDVYRQDRLVSSSYFSDQGKPVGYRQDIDGPADAHTNVGLKNFTCSVVGGPGISYIAASVDDEGFVRQVAVYTQGKYWAWDSTAMATIQQSRYWRGPQGMEYKHLKTVLIPVVLRSPTSRLQYEPTYSSTTTSDFAEIALNILGTIVEVALRIVLLSLIWY